MGVPSFEMTVPIPALLTLGYPGRRHSQSQRRSWTSRSRHRVLDVTHAVSAERGYGDLVDRGADGDMSGPVDGPRDLPRRHPPEREQERPSMDGLSCRAERQGIHLRPRSPCPLNKEWRPRRPFPPGTAPTDLRPIRRLGAPTVIVNLARCDGLVTSARILSEF